MARVRQIAIGNGAAETSPSVPQVMRAKPFPAVNGLLTPTGRRINWLHTVVPNSRGLECFQATEAVYAEHAGQIERHGITWGYFLTANGPSGFGVETLIHWSDEPYPLHRAFSRKAIERGLKFRPKDMEARAAVRTITSSIIERWAGLGGVHLQIGRKYPYLETRQPQTRGLVEAFKRLVDPDNVINPGNLVGHGHDQGLE